ncbi:MAG: pyruvate dehydrogenase complex dihydrolipoamide acetyltransferase [Labilithrix sp.]|nr:pyruvate dehydrogenase complex dihydrolipoamide acetyltransferase [Labilithrix sp.]
MAKILDMPKLSPTMEEGVLATWHKKEGDSVEVDDLLAEVETDKATMEFRAFDKGTLLKLLVEAGAEVKLGQPVAILGNEGEDISSLVAEAGGGAAEKTPAAKKKDAKRDEPEAEEEEPEEEDEPEGDEDEDADDEEPAETPRSPRAGAPKKKAAAAPKKKAARAAAPQTMRPSAPVDKGNVLTRTERDVATPARGGANGERVLASPYVRKVARERGIDLAGAQGSGEHGRIVPADLDALGKGEPREKAPAPLARAGQPGQTGLLALAPPEVRPLSPMRKTIARRLTQSKQTVPHFYLTIDVDAEELVALREQINADLAAGAKPSGGKPNGEAPKADKISINDLLIKACAAALRRVPETNASFTDEAILVHDRVDVSVAVAIPDGLVTPVVRDADRKSVVAIAREVRDLASRARAKKLKPEEMSDGTFSISNLGMFGIDEFAAVINPPEGAILAVGQVRDEPVVKNGAVAPGKKLAVTLSCDHRVVDGAVGAAFLAELRDLLERPMRILTG